MATWTTLLAEARSQLGDPGGDRWSDRTMVRRFAEAQEQACRKGYLIRDNTQTVTISAGTLEYSFPTNAIYIIEMTWGGRSEPLTKRDSHYMARFHPGWNDGTKDGDPEIYVTDRINKKFQLYRTPDSDAITESSTLTLVCVMLPSTTPTLDHFRDDSTTPEVEPEHHYELIDYVMYRCHWEDSEADGRQKAKEDLAIFEANMREAKREFAMQQQGNRRMSPQVV